MSFINFFSEQAKKPTGLFGRFVMSKIFDLGNAKLNQLVYEMLSVDGGDHILEIGFGTGKLIKKMAGQINEGRIEGIDFSNTMVSIALRRNKEFVSTGKVKILKADFDEMPFKQENFNKVCSINTIYFWREPEKTVKKIEEILKPSGILALGFEDISILEKRKLSNDIFRLYSLDDAKNLLRNNGFSNRISSKTIKFGSSVLNCVSAIKP